MHSANMIHGKLALFPLHEAIAAGVQIRPPVCLHHELTLLMKVACHPLLVMCKLCFDVAGCMLLTAVVGLTAAAAAAATAAAAAAAAAFVIVFPSSRLFGEPYEETPLPSKCRHCAGSQLCPV